uniref:Uncharacterized protein n=1 Tax=Anguilla anguilla TaxID=7936 RepID=A0A0E9SRS2_ANGAN
MQGVKISDWHEPILSQHYARLHCDWRHCPHYEGQYQDVQARWPW